MTYKYSELNTKNPKYDEIEIRMMNLLYKGSTEILKLQNIQYFIKQDQGETVSSYYNRLSSAVYNDYLSEIINKYASALFSKQMVVVKQEDKEVEEEYFNFFNNADNKNNSLPQVLKKLFIKASLHKRAYLTIDFPKQQNTIVSRAEELASKSSKPYICILHNEQLIDWEKDEFNNFKWCIIKDELQERTSLSESRNTKTIRFKYWYIEDNVAKYCTYAFKCKTNKEPNDNDVGLLIDEGITSFKQIPVIEFKLPKGLCIGSLIGTNCINIFKRKTDLYYSEKRSLLEIAVVKLGPEITAPNEALPPQVQQDPNRNKRAIADLKSTGFTVLGHNDEISFAGPSGKAWEICHEQIKQDTDEIHRVTHTMADSIALNNNSAKSAASKLADDRAMEIVLTAFADYIKEFTIKLYKVISEALNDNIEWKILGLDSYRIVNRTQTLDEVKLFGIPPSKTLKKLTYLRLSSELEEIPPELMDDVKNEIDQFIDSTEDTQSQEELKE